MDLKSLVSNIIAICFLVLLFLLAFTWIIFEFGNSSSSLKDSLSIVSSLFGGITTLAAAYIGSKLFNHWRDTESFIRTQSLYDSCIETAYNATNSMEEILNLLNKNLNNQQNYKISKIISDTISLTFELISRVGMDYNESINNDKKLQNIFEVILMINKEFREYKENLSKLNYNDIDSFSNRINSRLDEISELNLSQYNHYF